MAIEIPHWSKGSVVLMGLVHKTTPAEARSAYEYSLIDAYPDDKIKDQMQTMAVILYHHSMNSGFLNFHSGKVPSGSNTIGFLLSALFLAPSPSGNRSDLTISKLKEAVRLPLAEWDDLFYALQAEVRQIYTSLKEDIGFDIAAGRKILHCAGPGGISTNQPYSVLDMAVQLEEMWFLLNDQHLIAGLDKAIRIRTVREATKKKFANDEDPSLMKLIAAWGPDDGLYNTHAASPQKITLMLFAKINAQFDLEMSDVQPFGVKKKFLAAARSEGRTRARTARRAEKVNQVDTTCLCQDTCHCQVEMDCRLQSGECPCAFARSEIRELIGFQREIKSNVQKDATIAGILTPTANTFLDADSNEEARMQVAGLATADPYIVQMCRINADEAAKRDDQMYALHKARSRTGTNELELAYVPGPKTPGRSTKDPFPLGLYSNSPGQRYPKHDLATYAFAAVPRRKPVPSPKFKPRALTYGEGEVPPLLLDRETSHSPATQAAFLATPVSRSQAHFSNPISRPNQDSHHDLNVNVPASEYVDLAVMARRLANPFDDVDESPFAQSSSPEPSATVAPHPASEQDLQSSQRPAEAMVRAHTFTEGEACSRAPIFHHDGCRSENYTPTPYQSLPATAPEATPEPTSSPLLPDVIVSRSVPKQRYVSAGGNAKLSERPEIEGPATLFNSIPSGSTISKAAVFEQLNDPVFAQQYFHENRAAVAAAGQRTAERARGSGSAMTPQQNRSPPRSGAREKRERQGSTDSAGRGRMAKLKRVFSRSGSSP